MFFQMADDTCQYYKNLTNGGDTILTNQDISFYMYYYTLVFLITLINIIGNSMIITAFIKHKKLR